MRKTITTAAAMFVLSVSGLGAQSGVQLGYSAGFTAEHSYQTGITGGLSITVPTPLAFASLRAEGMVQHARYRDFFLLADILVRPVPGRQALYAIAGYGASLDGGGDKGTWTVGAGVDLAEVMSVPIFLEFRHFAAPQEFSGLSFGVNF